MPGFKSRCFASLLWNEKVLLASCLGRSTQWGTVDVCWTPLLPHDPLMGHFPHHLYNILWFWSMKPNGGSSWTLPQPLTGAVLGTRGCSTAPRTECDQVAQLLPEQLDVAQVFLWAQPQGKQRDLQKSPDWEPAVVPPVLGRTTCHSVLSADVCFHSGLDRLGGKLDAFQSCPSLISSHRVENNWSYFCHCTSAQAVFVDQPW